MYVVTTKDEGNAADGRFSTACYWHSPLSPVPLRQGSAEKLRLFGLYLLRAFEVPGPPKNI